MSEANQLMTTMRPAGVSAKPRECSLSDDKSRPGEPGGFWPKSPKLVRCVLLNRKVLRFIGQTENVDGVDLARAFIGNNRGMGRNRNDYRENERGQSQDTQNLGSHFNVPLQSSLSAPTLCCVGIVGMSPGKLIGIARIALRCISMRSATNCT